MTSRFRFSQLFSESSLLGEPGLANDQQYQTNDQRVKHRASLIPQLQARFLQHQTEEWIEQLRHVGIPCGAIQRVGQALTDPQIAARGMIWECPHPTASTIRLVGSPLHLSRTPPRLYNAPPLLGEHTFLECLQEDREG